jgi:F-type H+-transporting ATPase subunit delta
LGAHSSKSSAVAKRYAAALFDLASEAGSRDRIEAELAGLSGLLAESADLSRALASPAYSADQKQGVVLALADKAKVDPLLRSFLGTLGHNRRAAELGGVAAAFAVLCAEARGGSQVIARTAHKMTKAQGDKLAKLLKSKLGHEVELVEDVDPDLIGGLQIRIGSRLVDASLRAKLTTLKTVMKGA